MGNIKLITKRENFWVRSTIYPNGMMVFGVVLFIVGGWLCTVNLWFIPMAVVGVVMLFIPIRIDDSEKKKDYKNKASYFLGKFGTTTPKLETVCLICHQKWGDHYVPNYDCPNNALYNYKTNQYEIRKEE
jgi:hypothetical protein